MNSLKQATRCFNLLCILHTKLPNQENPLLAFLPWKSAISIWNLRVFKYKVLPIALWCHCACSNCDSWDHVTGFPQISSISSSKPPSFARTPHEPCAIGSTALGAIQSSWTWFQIWWRLIYLAGKCKKMWSCSLAKGEIFCNGNFIDSWKIILNVAPIL